MDFLGFEFTPTAVFAWFVNAGIAGAVTGLLAVVLSAVGPRD